MSNTGFFLKPPVLVTVVVLIALIGLTAGLRNQADGPDSDSKAKSTEFEKIESGSTRITGISAPSSKIAGQGQSTAAHAPAKKSAPRKPIVEDFDMAVKRAEGNSVISGRVFGSLAERTDNGDRNGWFGGFGGFSGFTGGRTPGGQAPPAAQGGSSDTPPPAVATPDQAVSAEQVPAEDSSATESQELQPAPSDDGTSAGERRRERNRDRTDRGDRNTSDGQNRREFRRPDNGTTSATADWRSRFGDIKPIENAEILLFENDPNTTHPPLRTVKTDKEGSFTITGVNGNDQRYILVVKADKFAPEASFISVNDVPREVFVRLEKGYPLKGRVLDSETSQPVPGAVVYQPNPRFEASSAMGVTTTSITGEFYFPNTHPGGNVTQAHADGYATTRARVRAPDDETIIAMEPGGGSISGVTIDRLTGKPQGGAKVWATTDRDIAESVISAEDGTFKLKNLPAGEFKVYAVRGMKSEEQKVELKRGGTVADLSITLPAELLVSGQVINSKDRSPLPDVKVWFQSAKGATYRKTNADGRFSFETMAIDEYAILVHEKGFLPIQDRKSTEAKETIERKVAKNQSSDDLVIRLKPVPMIEGIVTGQSRRSNGDQPINDADVTLAFEDGRDFINLKTQSDPAGVFFFNLPGGERGKGVVVANKDYALDVKDVRVPRDKPVNLKLQRELMMGQVLLSDETPLDGIKVEVSRALSTNREDSKVANRVTLAEMNTIREGRLFGPLPRGENVELSFHMPDGVTVSKAFQTNRLLDSRPIFVYDPVSQDVVADTTPRDNNRGRWGNRGGQGNGQNNGQGNGQNGQNGQGRGGNGNGQGGNGQGGNGQAGNGQAGNGQGGNRPGGATQVQTLTN